MILWVIWTIILNWASSVRLHRALLYLLTEGRLSGGWKFQYGLMWMVWRVLARLMEFQAVCLSSSGRLTGHILMVAGDPGATGEDEPSVQVLLKLVLPSHLLTWYWPKQVTRPEWQRSSQGRITGRKKIVATFEIYHNYDLLLLLLFFF